MFGGISDTIINCHWNLNIEMNANNHVAVSSYPVEVPPIRVSLD